MGFNYSMYLKTIFVPDVNIYISYYFMIINLVWNKIKNVTTLCKKVNDLNTFYYKLNALAVVAIITTILYYTQITNEMIQYLILISFKIFGLLLAYFMYSSE